MVIVNWNRAEMLSTCLNSLSDQTFRDFEAIVVDNGSTDGSVRRVRSQFPDVSLIALGENTGFSVANNIGIRAACGEYMALLNNDAEAESHWLEELVKVLRTHSEIGFCASKMVLWDDRSLADGCGDFYTPEGVAGKIGHLDRADRYDEPREVFGASAGAAMYLRSMFEDIGGFDEDFFMVHEDTDLNFRGRLMGYRCLYVPTAIVYHRLGGTIGVNSEMNIFHDQRNIEFVFLKNMPTSLMVRYLPLHLIANWLSFVKHLLRSQARTFIRAKADALRFVPKMIQKRRRIQSARRASAQEISAAMTKGWLANAIKRQARSFFDGRGIRVKGDASGLTH